MRTTKLLTTILLVLGCGNPTIETPLDSSRDSNEVIIDQPDTTPDTILETSVDVPIEPETSVDSSVIDTTTVDSSTIDTQDVVEVGPEAEVGVDSGSPDTGIPDTGMPDTGDPCRNTGDIYCDGNCWNPRNSINHCGSCNHRCMVGFPVDTNVIFGCINRVCDCRIITPGMVENCSGSCTYLFHNDDACGSCTNRCPVGQWCSTRFCVACRDRGGACSPTRGRMCCSGRCNASGTCD